MVTSLEPTAHVERPFSASNGLESWAAVYGSWAHSAMRATVNLISQQAAMLGDAIDGWGSHHLNLGEESRDLILED